jgi:hypothetical protein
MVPVYGHAYKNQSERELRQINRRSVGSMARTKSYTRTRVRDVSC